MKTVTLRNVPEELRDRLQAQADAAGLSLSDYLLRVFRQVAEVPTEAEMRKRAAGLNRRR